VIYFLNINSDGGVESYTYLSSADDSLGDYWGPNVALGWTVENIGDIDGTTREQNSLGREGCAEAEELSMWYVLFVSPGDGVADLAVGAIGYPAGTSHGAVYILFLTPDNKIREYKYVASHELLHSDEKPGGHVRG
jgi:hypothetical protein